MQDYLEELMEELLEEMDDGEFDIDIDSCCL